jgi:hypothetical protein
VCSAAAQGPRAPPPCVSLRPEGPLLGNSRLMSPGSACWERNRDSGPGPGLPRTLNYQCWEVTSRSLLGVSNSPGGPGVPRSMHGWGMPSSCGRGRLGTQAQAGAKPQARLGVVPSPVHLSSAAAQHWGWTEVHRILRHGPLQFRDPNYRLESSSPSCAGFCHGRSLR